MKLAIYDKKGKEVEKVELPKEIFDLEWNGDLVHQVIMALTSNHRSGTAHTKGRGEVSGGGKKPWKQKGTGRARHGSIRSPIWIGGGTTHGPRSEKNYDRKLNKKVKAKALAVILSQKARDNEIILVDSIKVDDIKTKEAVSIISALSKNDSIKNLKTKRNNSALISLSERDDKTEKSFRNIKNVRLDLIKNLNLLDLVNYKYLVLVNPKESFAILADRVKTSK